MDKKVSIVIITYNQEEFVHETIESCLNQTYKNIEIIISDDGSKDKTPEIIKRYAKKHPGKIIPILHPVNTGIAENSNRGLKIASGDYIIWFGGDDIMKPKRVEKQIKYLEEHTEYSACYSDADVFEWPSGKEAGLFSRVYSSGKFELIDIKKYLHPECVLLPSAIMFRRTAMQDRYVDERIKMMNDYLFYAQLLIHGGPFGYIRDSLIKYRVSEKSVRKSEKVIQSAFEELLITSAILEAKYPHLSRLIEKRTINDIFNSAATQIKFGNKKRFKNLCLLAINRGARIKGVTLLLFGAPAISYLSEHRDKYETIINKIKKK